LIRFCSCPRGTLPLRLGVDFICHFLRRKWRNEVPSTKSDPIAGNERANFPSHPLLTKCRKCRLGEEGTGYLCFNRPGEEGSLA
jgi:hypothetical protein